MNTIEEDKEALPPCNLKCEIETLVRGGLSPLQIAVEAGVNSRELLAWLERGIEPAPESLGRLQTWLKDEARAGQGGQALADPGYVETPTARKIVDALDYSRYSPTIAVVYGGAGVGKTTALDHYAQTRPRTWMITAAQALRTPLAILMELVGDTHGRGGFAYRLDALFKEAKDEMRRTEYQTINGLLLVDEAQHLDTPVFDAIRSLHDQAGIGIVYAGNEEVYDRIHGKKKSRLPQIYSRVGMRLHIAGSTPEDADAFLEAYGVKGREERKYAQAIAATPGGLRGLRNLIRYARLTAADRCAPITIDMLKEAAMDCGIFV